MSSAAELAGEPVSALRVTVDLERTVRTFDLVDEEQEPELDEATLADHAARVFVWRGKAMLMTAAEHRQAAECER